MKYPPGLTPKVLVKVLISSDSPSYSTSSYFLGTECTKMHLHAVLDSVCVAFVATAVVRHYVYG